MDEYFRRLARIFLCSFGVFSPSVPFEKEMPMPSQIKERRWAHRPQSTLVAYPERRFHFIGKTVR
jgi:hypothetical protein